MRQSRRNNQDQLIITQLQREGVLGKKAQQARVDLTRIAFKAQDEGDDDKARLASLLAKLPKSRKKEAS